MFRQHLRLVGRQLQMQARDRKWHRCITALQPRTAVELPEGRVYKSTLLVYTVRLCVLCTRRQPRLASIHNAHNRMVVNSKSPVNTRIELNLFTSAMMIPN